MTKGGKSKRKQGYSVVDILLGAGAPKPKPSGNRNAKRIQGSKNHHDSLKGGGGNNTGRGRR